jgi:hypothetical protein
MDIDKLKARFERLKKSDDDIKMMEFADELISSDDPEVIAFHYDLLGERKNDDFYLILRDRFSQRGRAAAKFLESKYATEKDRHARADILLMLGLMRHPPARSLARQALTAKDPELRDNAVAVLGWMGTAEDVDRIGDRLLNDAEPIIRGSAAAAFDQIVDNVPQTRGRMLRLLKEALQKEKDRDVMGWIIIAVQDLTGKKCGLREDLEEGDFVGNVEKAKVKCMNVLDTLVPER